MKKILFSLGLILASFLFIFGIKTTTTQEVQASNDTGVIWANTETDTIKGSYWSPIGNILVTLEEHEFNIQAAVGGSFGIDLFGTEYEVEPGNTITATHAGNTVEYVVLDDLEISEVNRETKTVSGTAPGGSDVVIWSTEMGQGGRHFIEVEEVQAEGGTWSVTFTQELGGDIYAFLFEDSLDDIKDGEENLDDVTWNSNATFVKDVSDPGGFILAAYPQVNTIWGHDWPYGNLTVTVTRGSQTFTYNYGIHNGGDFQLHYDDHKINLEIGDTITATIGELSMSHKIINLTITEIDTVNNTISGTADPNKPMTVQIGADYGSQGEGFNYRFINAGSDGKWIADFSTPQTPPWGGDPYGIANITETTKFWIHQNTEFDSPRSPWAEGRTIIANQYHLLELVRSFIVTRMAEFAAISTNISAVLDDPSQQLVFESENLGRIAFSSFDIETLLVINPEYLENLEDFVKITYDTTNNTLSSKVETSTLDFLAGHSATIQFFNVAKNLGVTDITAENVRDYIDIKVYDENVLVTDISDYFDWDNVVYNAETDTLTLPVNHFTEYVLGVTSEAETGLTETELPETGMGVIYLVTFGIVSLGLGYVVLRKKKFLS